MTHVIGSVDWGGTWLRVALVDDGRVLHRERMSRPAALQDQCDAVDALLRRCVVAAKERPSALGVGVAGIVQSDSVMTAINIGITTVTEIADGLAAAVGIPTFIVNDAQAAAIDLGAAWPNGVTAVLTMGTGIGGAVIAEGRLVVGNGAAGDFGHMIVAVDGPRCPCGGCGCLEMLASGKVLAATAADLASSGRSEFLAARSVAGRALHAGDLQDAADSGDGPAHEALERAATALTAGVRTIVATLDPARIVLAGALLSDEARFGRLVREHWASTRPGWCATPLLHVVDDENAVLRGAARFAAARLAGRAD